MSLVSRRASLQGQPNTSAGSGVSAKTDAAGVGGPATLTLAQTTTELLRQSLLDGRYAPLERLHEESLSALLRVSRTPIRSALHSLAAEGLLDYVPNRGYSVRRGGPRQA